MPSTAGLLTRARKRHTLSHDEKPIGGRGVTGYNSRGAGHRAGTSRQHQEGDEMKAELPPAIPFLDGFPLLGVLWYGSLLAIRYLLLLAALYGLVKFVEWTWLH